MKMLVAAIAAAAMAAPAIAQDAPRPADGRAKPMAMESMSPQQMHEHCAAVMGGKMQGKREHDHAADKLGHVPRTTPPTEAEMKAMHDWCAAAMADAKTPAAPPKP
jgi:hypothetical protein